MDRLISENLILSLFDGKVEQELPLFSKTMTRIIKGLPSADPMWIPVSERLPEESGRYLAYIISRHDDKLQYIMTCDYSADGYWNWFPDDECASDNVIAWMPLPKPYEPQEKQCADCNHYGTLSLVCGRCDDDCSMYDPQERSEE